MWVWACVLPLCECVCVLRVCVRVHKNKDKMKKMSCDSRQTIPMGVVHLWADGERTRASRIDKWCIPSICNHLCDKCDGIIRRADINPVQHYFFFLSYDFIPINSSFDSFIVAVRFLPFLFCTLFRIELCIHFMFSFRTETIKSITIFGEKKISIVSQIVVRSASSL